MIKWKILLCFLLPIILTLKPKEYTSIITFESSGPSSSGSGVEINGTDAKIVSAGSYLITGASDLGSVLVTVDSVNLFLQNLNLESNITAPIIVNSKLTDVSITSLENVFLINKESPDTSTGECAVIKVKKKSKVTINNEKDFSLTGTCKNVIKGGVETSIIFGESNGEYIIKGYKNGISSDHYLEINGGTFTIETETGDAIKSSPDDTDTTSEGKIVINNGVFNIDCYEDAFTAKKVLHINDGTFDIKTEDGYNSKTFDKDTMSAKGFKLSNNETGCEIVIKNGNFKLNTPDDAFHSNGNLTVINGNFEIYSGDDGMHADFNLTLGEKGAKTGPIINIYNSYEGLEAQFIDIYYAKIDLNASDDGINAASGSSGDDPGPGPGPGPRPGPPPNLRLGPPGPPPGPHGDSSLYIAIYDGEINVLCKGDGLDSNGAVYIHGGRVNVFSQGPDEGGDNEPIDHDGNFDLYDGEVLCGGNKGMEAVHEGITAGNEKYAYYTSKLSANSILKIKNENGAEVRQHKIPKNIAYLFYSSINLTEKYKFYVSDSTSGTETELSFTFGTADGNFIKYGFSKFIFVLVTLLLLL